MLILASKSPRRKEILEKLGFDFLCVTKECDESFEKDTPPELVVMNLAQKKADAVLKDRPNDVVIGSDTIVYFENQFLTKPRDREDAKRMLLMLSCNSHYVYTGVCIKSKFREDLFYNKTEVKFSSISDRDIEDYLDSGEPFDKAGAYGIQGLGCRFVESISGDFFSVMGLPAQSVFAHLKNFDF